MVLDLGLPGISGIEVVERLRREGQDLPVCVFWHGMRSPIGWPACGRGRTTTLSSPSISKN